MTGRSMETPATWLSRHAALLPAGGRALDVACGRGRNALWLAARGLMVDALDRDAGAIAALQAAASADGLVVHARVADLESGSPDIPSRAYDVVVTNYLHRPLFPALVAALNSGGLLIYETFTRAQALRGKPSNPAFLLEPGELRRLVAPLEVLAEREGEFEDRDISAVVARR
jgi:SAM-dependent methyltransferase